MALFSASGLSDFWRGCHFSASGLSDFWRRRIFQLLVLAIFGDFLEDLFLALFSASGLSNFLARAPFFSFWS